MKVIIIKKWKKYNVNEIVEVKNGFGANFLIKNGHAVPINKNTIHVLETKKELEKEIFQKNVEQANLLKKQIEELKLIFFLKTTGLVVHGSITNKKVNQTLIENGIKLEKHALPHIFINSLGITKVKIRLFNNVYAQLMIEVKSE